MAIDTHAVAQEIVDAYATGDMLDAPLSSRPGFDLSAAYAVEAELARRRRAAGRTVVGRKIAFANEAIWRKFNIQTVAWGSMYDDTVQKADAVAATPVPFTYKPKLEPEIVFKVKRPITDHFDDPAAIMRSVEWLSLGYEIVDCPFPDWTFQPADLVGAFGFHAGLVLGEPTLVTPANAASLGAPLAIFTLKLFKNDAFVEEGGGQNVLCNPALALGEFAAALSRSPWAEPLTAGELVSTGSLTTPMLIAPGDTWRAEPDGLPVASVTMKL